MSRTSRAAMVTALVCVAAVGAWFLLTLDRGEPRGLLPLGPSLAAAGVVQTDPEPTSPLEMVVPEQREELRLGAAVIEPSAASGTEAPTPVADHRVLSGRVLDSLSKPAANALVALIGVKGGKPVNAGDSATTRANRLGHFRLDVPSWAWQQQVLVAARLDGWRPYSALVSLGPTYLEGPHDYSLGPGCEIAGFVVRDGTPVVGARVDFDIAPGTYTLEVTSDEHDAVTQTVVVEAGKVTKASMVLEPL